LIDSFLIIVVVIVQICRSSLLSGRYVRWPRRMLHPGESRWVCRRASQTVTDGRGQRNKCRASIRLRETT